MRHGFRYACGAALALAVAAAGSTQADVIVLSPAHAHGIRQFPGGPPFSLTFLSINASTEDRTVLEFDLRGLGGSVTGATLDLDLFNLDPGGPVGVIDVFPFPGTGTVTPDLFSAGTFLTSLSNNQSELEHADVTVAVRAAVVVGEPFLGFRLSTATGDRFLLGPPFTQLGPTLTVSLGPAEVPEPSTLVLLALGSLGLLSYGGRRRGGAAGRQTGSTKAGSTACGRSSSMV
jgi:hypothetical protein